MEMFLKTIEQLNPVQLAGTGVMLWFFYNRLDSKIDKLDTKIDKLRDELNTKIDKLRDELNTKIDVKIDKLRDELNTKIDMKIDKLRDELNTRIDSLYNLMFTYINNTRFVSVEQPEPKKRKRANN